MKIIRILLLLMGLLCIFLGLLTPLNLIFFIGIGIGMILISAVLLKLIK